MPFVAYKIWHTSAFSPFVLWNTLYFERTLDFLRAPGRRVEPKDVVRLSPLQHAHINVLGRHQFLAADPLRSGEYRPLRTPEGKLLLG